MTVKEVLNNIKEHTDYDIYCFICKGHWMNNDDGVLINDYMSVDDTLYIYGNLIPKDWTICVTYDFELNIGFLF